MTSNRRWIAQTGIVAVGVVAALTAVSAPSYAAGTVAGTVSSGNSNLTVRAGAASWTASLGRIRSGTNVKISCYVAGENIKGRVRTTTNWDRLVNGQYVSDAYIKRTAAVPLCPPAPVAVPVPAPVVPVIVPPTGAVPIGRWVSPVPGPGTSGFRTASRPTHDGIDMMAVRATPIHAAAIGTVIRVVCNTNGPSCDVDGSPTTTGCGWYAEIQHAGNIITRYCHMLYRPSVEVGAVVQLGQIIGYVGTSGHSSGTHVHFEVHFGAAPATRLNAIDPVPFMAAAGAPVA
jgi:murein DD-endopeptidase MepM/ murein hydrolase activator NlpD